MCFSGFVAKCSAKWRIFVCLTTFNSSGYSPIMKELVYLTIKEKFFLAGIHMMGNNLTLLDELIPLALLLDYSHLCFLMNSE